MGKSAVKGLFYICLIAATFVLATITIVAAFSGNVAPVDSVISAITGAGSARTPDCQSDNGTLLGIGP